MYKLLTCMLVVAAMSAASAQRFPMTIGGSGVIRADFAGYVVKDLSNLNGTGFARLLDYSQTTVVAGEYLSFEAFMCELGVSLWSGRTTIRETIAEAVHGKSGNSLSSGDRFALIGILRKYDVVGMDLSLFIGKYPFGLGRRVKFFPQVGICYQIVLTITNANPSMIRFSDFNALSFKPGGGFDFTITKRLLLRAEALFALRLDNRFEKQLKKQFNSNRASVGYGPEIKFGVRYRLNRGGK